MHVGAALFFISGPLPALASILINPLVALLSAVLVGLAAAALARAARRRALVWGLLSAALGFSALGDAAWSAAELLGGRAPALPAADFLYLLFYLLFLAGVCFIPTRPPRLHDWVKGVIDVLIVLLTAALALWVYLLSPLAASSAGRPPLETAAAMLYPLGDIALLAALLIVLFLAAGYPVRRSLWLVMAGLALFIVTDLIFASAALRGGYQAGAWFDAGYSLAYLAFGLAGYVETLAARQPGLAGERPFGSPPAWAQLLPYLWVVLAYVIFVSGIYIELPVNAGRLAIFVGVITGLVLLRQVIALYENARLSASLAQALQQVKEQASNLERANREMHGEIVERRRIAERLSYDAMHDTLTGLPNRALFLDRLAHVTRKKRRNPAGMYAVMFLDLDGFKLVNDSLGHAMGDKLLVRVAWSLTNCMRATDTVARLGGDEFVILVEEIASAQAVLDLANRVQAELRQPINLEGTLVYISASIGVVLDVQAGQRPEDLLRDADLAMYYAKGQGKARYAVFHPGMRDSAVSRLALEGELRRAIEQAAFYLEYQPTFNLSNGRLVGFEALLRWQHPERGRVDPNDFLPVAEDSGLILPMGKWTLEEACRQAAAWPGRYPWAGPLKVSVNISGRQLKDSAFVDVVAAALQHAGLPGERLVLEVTETACLDSLEALRATFSALKALGVVLQIDDFGTGYSALSYLQSLPVQAIKIDRSFVEPIHSQGDPRPLEIVRAILAMARSLNIEVTAEGIETRTQLTTLARLGCHYGQGYYLAHPMAQTALEQWMVNLAMENR